MHFVAYLVVFSDRFELLERATADWYDTYTINITVRSMCVSGLYSTYQEAMSVGSHEHTFFEVMFPVNY